MRLRVATIVATALAGAALASCAIRYDQAGVSRVGIFLWGFGDPPGVNWNLDWPRQEIPDLPAGPRRDLPPRAPARAPADTRPPALVPAPRDSGGAAIDDNRGCAERCAPPSTAAVARRADDRGDVAVRR